MDISLPQNDDRQSLIATVYKKMIKGFEVADQKALKGFLDYYLASFPLEEWVGRNFDDLVGFCFQIWLEMQERPKKSARVKVFNPNLDEDGWLCGRTAIFVHQQDMPFLVDSLRIELNRREIPIHVIYSCVLNVVTQTNGQFVKVVNRVEKKIDLDKGQKVNKEALIYVEISLTADTSILSSIRQSLDKVFADVKRAVTDYSAMREKLSQAKSNLAQLNSQGEEVCEFLDWLDHSHFTFLGYREYNYVNEGGTQGIEESVEQRLGVFKAIGTERNFISVEDFSDGAKVFKESKSIIGFSKSSTRTNVHRDVYPDYVVLKKVDAQGQFCGEVRFLGLFTYSVVNMSPRQIPILKSKCQALIERSGYESNSHAGKNFIRVIENFLKEELFQSDIDTLYDNVKSIAEINERHVVRLILRKDPFGSFVNCMVYVPRDVYTTRTRLAIQKIIGKALGTQECDSTSYFSESTLARAQFVFKVENTSNVEVDVQAIENQILDITKNWEEYFSSGLLESYGESLGVRYFNQYRHAFSQSYQENYDPRMAVKDIEFLSRIVNRENDIALHLYKPPGSSASRLRFKIFRQGQPVELSDAIPVLENLGLRVLGEQPYEVRLTDDESIWLHDFDLVLSTAVDVDVHVVRQTFEEAFDKIWHGEAESDPFNRLILTARLSWREVALLRAYTAYLRQISFNSTKEFIADTLVNHTDITRNILAIFKAQFDPRYNKDQDKVEGRIEKIRTSVMTALDDVSNLNEDIVIRRYLELIGATLRTNYFQLDGDLYKPYLSIKFSPKIISDMPEPKPLYEIFVYSPKVEGVHLRGGKVARGGLRWSDRLQDYRTEVLGLVKAQQVKNAVIVPNGAKGGFVAKTIPNDATREEAFSEGVACYKIFIQGLLDLTDNLIDGKLVPPDNVLRRDEDDPYLVVAADKGTATFSDIANDISLKYGHWLGDAFASGGSQGYDHKGMGITAKGAWISVQRHFRERGIDIQNEDFTVVGIGDMAGDVFGNGMLLSEHICLTAAFNHLHIFIDPSPNSAASFKERERMFNTPGSSWDDFDKSLISKGGGVFLRAAKSIPISPEMKRVFNIKASSLTPNALIHALLKAPVDLIWNGGIGTYVKASWETHADVGDKANDSLRVDGRELKCRVIGEGGNLGLTQLGRIEFCLNGGACNTDFIDNAAGVDCSDHEVNIKILLDEVVRKGDLTSKQRNKLLADMTDDVSELVLNNNYRQTQSISMAAFEVDRRINEYRRFIHYLESKGRLNRKLEFLLSDEEIVERVGQGKSLTRPELSVLVSYAKVMLKEELIASDISKNSYIVKEVETAFPERITKKFKQEVYDHRLKREIVGTQVANDMINSLGITSAQRLLETTGASLEEIATAYVISRDIFRFGELQNYIRTLDNSVSSGFQSKLLSNMVRRVRRGTRWFLRNRRSGLTPDVDVPLFLTELKKVYKETAKSVQGIARDKWQANLDDLINGGVEESWALTLAMPSNLFSGLGIVQTMLNTERSAKDVTFLFYRLLDELNLTWFANQLSDVKVETYWQAIARESYIDDLEAQVRKIAEAILRLQGNLPLEEAYVRWESKNTLLIERWKVMVNEVQSIQTTDYAMFSVALKELIDLGQASFHCESFE